MVNLAKVLALLNVLEAWDPSQLFALGGATTTALVGYRLLPSLCPAPLFEPTNAATSRLSITGRQIRWPTDATRLCR
jgi:hypothetical protein